MECPTYMELQSLTEELVALEAAGQRFEQSMGACNGAMILIPFSPEYGLVRRCLEMLEANTNGLVDCEFGGLTMTSLSSTSRALGYLARLETHCKCVTQEYLDTGEKSTGRLHH